MSSGDKPLSTLIQARLLHGGSKLYTLRALHEIAKSVTHTDYLEVVVIANPCVPEHLRNPDLVIKRSYSDAAEHVWKSGDERDLATMQELVKDANLHYNHESLRRLGVKPVWFGVPYIPQVVQKGEIRCYFVGGVLTYMISTKPLTGDELGMELVHEITPLTHLSCVSVLSPLVSC